MKQFVYKEKFAVSHCYPALVFIALTIMFAVFQYSIAIKNLTLLTYPVSVYVFAACALACIVYAWLKYSRAQESQQNPNQIEIGESSFSFPKGKGKATVDYDDVKELWRKNESDQDLIVIYTVASERYEFRAAYFASKEAFAEFEEILDMECSNVIVR